MPVIALMTDFGTRDHYVAAMKGVILQINPKVTFLDITHEIGPQDLLHGAFVLRQAVPYLPTGTIVVAVVDPGVGSTRHVVAARYNDRIVIAPDNGLLTLLHRDAELQDLRIVENRRYFASTLSSTFHGRDIMAPVAAHLTRGVQMAHLGPPARHIEILQLTQPDRNSNDTIDGRVILIDHFGNLITNISLVDLSGGRGRRTPFSVSVDDHDVGPIRNTYADVPVGEPLALVGSAQLLEIAVHGGSAARTLGVERGAIVQLR
jgi:hypothetical protein